MKTNKIKTNKRSIDLASLPNKGNYDYNEKDNLGLDADGSSVNSGKANYNNDNDRISHNPDGEDDTHNTTEEPGYSPLMDK
ncbi:hypothetical protein [Pedobacter lusitanus]|uniref:hypothetical protein n=1 Tax=Pedobacter lusitanus TaxID=1503925 RepID=UPI000AB1C959|nr:hypothetical protein [Pedobacter lusitanus]